MTVCVICGTPCTGRLCPDCTDEADERHRVKRSKDGPTAPTS